jgi:hypothetical protein
MYRGRRDGKLAIKASAAGSKHAADSVCSQLFEQETEDSLSGRHRSAYALCFS